jgi:aminoglycoside 3-N-acetyltransferase
MENRKMDDVTRMTGDLAELGVRAGGALLVHSSLRSLGPLASGAEGVIVALQQVLGDDGTLFLPALSYESVGEKHPLFDLNSTPSCVGALTEYFRQRAGTLRSLHPTHSVCATGKRAGELLQGHQRDDTPCGPHSPFRRLRDAGGQILFIGCGLTPNTSMHGVEELVEPAYLFGKRIAYEITDGEGARSRTVQRSHDFSGWRQRFDRLKNVLEGDSLREGKLLEAQAHLVDARAMWEQAEVALRDDPYYFVERIA